MEQTSPETPNAKPDRLTLVLRYIVGLILFAIVLVGSLFAYAYASSPAALRQPAHDHFHFRLQMVIDGKTQNFADDAFQTEFNKDICTADLTKEPIHFHDKLDQFVHIHWKGMTGGLLLKDYGLNLIGGAPNTLGYRFDQLPNVTRVPIHGQDLTKPEAGDRYYIYTGDQNGYQKRDWNQFVNASLRDFFAGKTSSLFNVLVPGANADSNEVDLAQLNDVVGSAVIFVQKTPPTDAQIKDRFNHLIPLPQSSCSG